MPKVIIIGAGLAGSLLAINLARRGIKVEIYEARGDMRLEEVGLGRSINLALSDRGIAALREVGMGEYMLSEAVPMTGRMIHVVSGQTKLLPYSGRQGEYINSVSRAGLNIALMNEADKYDEVTFHFNERCEHFDCASGVARFSSGVTVSSDTQIATDGAGSAVRLAMEDQLDGFQSDTIFLDHGYKELHIPPGENAEFLLEKNVLHIWPRNKFMMIALPNFDGSFTCTLFLGHKKEPPSSSSGGQVEPQIKSVSPAHAGVSTSFDQLTEETSVRDFFNREFPDAVPLMPTLVEDFFANPTGKLGTVKCFPWNVGGKALLLGDAAHAVVPFYGQGMNCSFEDVRALAGLIDKQTLTADKQGRAENSIDWQTIFEEYGAVRKINTDAIADMAEENFYEMRDATADPIFQRKRELETKLEQTFPDYFSKYSMVTFREDMPYSVAKEKGNAQDALLMEMCAEAELFDELDLNEVLERVRKL